MDCEITPIQSPSPKGKEKIIEETSTDTPPQTPDTHISLRPQTSKGTTIFQFPLLKPTVFQIPVVEQQNLLMKELFELCNLKYRYVDFNGVYPRINFLQDSPPEEVRKWYDFGAINSIHMTSPNFPEIALLPQWIKEGVKDCYQHNPSITTTDILVLKFLSCGPDFYNEERYPAYHFIQLGKAESFSINVMQNKKIFVKFEESDIHYRRAIGIRVVLQGMEASFKKGFRTYGGKKIYSSIMITAARTSPQAAINFMTSKIRLLDSGMIRSHPDAQKRLCRYRQHQGNRCPACTKQIKIESTSTTIQQSSQTDSD